MNLHELTIFDAHDLLKKKEISSRELTRDVLARIAAVEPAVDAYITITGDAALAQADMADKRKIGRAHV